jgi:hypothetical protein
MRKRRRELSGADRAADRLTRRRAQAPASRPGLPARPARFVRGTRMATTAVGLWRLATREGSRPRQPSCTKAGAPGGPPGAGAFGPRAGTGITNG